MFSIEGSKNCIRRDYCEGEHLYIEKDEGWCQKKCPGEYLTYKNKNECIKANSCKNLDLQSKPQNDKMCVLKMECDNLYIQKDSNKC